VTGKAAARPEPTSARPGATAAERGSIEPPPESTAAGRSGGAWGAELAFAIDLAREAGTVLMDRYERLERIDHKSARDVVTEADHLSEALIIAAIRERDPADAILAEESGAHAADPATGDGPSKRIWVIDPLDGTVNYANGLPVFCVSIGLVVDGRPTVGVVRDPTRDETFAATADGPATLNGRPIHASSKEKLSDYVISLGLAGRSVASRAKGLRREIRISRSMGSGALGLAYVGNGRFDAFVQQTGLSAWDVAAAGVIAERAGAVVTALDGSAWYDAARPSRGVGIVAGPPRFHERIRALAAG
jgi:myo-inositol-1(or 4)-monophosphatase